jgi:hypothetical protein
MTNQIFVDLFFLYTFRIFVKIILFVDELFLMVSIRIFDIFVVIFNRYDGHNYHHCFSVTIYIIYNQHNADILHDGCDIYVCGDDSGIYTELSNLSNIVIFFFSQQSIGHLHSPSRIS